MSSEEWPVASVGNCVFRGIVPLQWGVRNGEWEQWGVGSGSSGKPKWDQWGVGPVGSGTSGQWEAGAGSVWSGKPEWDQWGVGLMESRIRSEWNQEWV